MKIIHEIHDGAQTLAGDDGRSGWCSVTIVSRDPISQDGDVLRLEGTTSSILDALEEAVAQVRALRIAHGDVALDAYVRREVAAEIVRKKFWDMAELHSEGAPEALASMILGTYSSECLDESSGH